MSGGGRLILQAQDNPVIAVIVGDVVEKLDVSLARKRGERTDVLNCAALQNRRAGGGLHPCPSASFFKSLSQQQWLETELSIANDEDLFALVG